MPETEPSKSKAEFLRAELRCQIKCFSADRQSNKQKAFHLKILGTLSNDPMDWVWYSKKAGRFAWNSRSQLESPIRVPEQRWAFHLRAQRNAFRRGDARQQSRLFAPQNQSL